MSGLPDLRIQELDPVSVALAGSNLVEASAGTGKTYAIAALYVRLVVEKKLPVSAILVVTFTEASTGELRSRIRARLREALRAFESGETNSGDAFLRGLLAKGFDRSEAADLLRQALRDFDQAAIYTIHGFCQRVLSENAFETCSLFDTDLLTEEQELVEAAAQDFWRKRVLTASLPFLLHFRKRGNEPDRYSSLAFKSLNHPLLEIEAPSGRPATHPAEAELADVFRRAKDYWTTERGLIVSRLDLSALSGKYYRTNWLAGWLTALDQLLSAEHCDTEPFDKLSKFTPESLEQATKVGSKTPDHPIFALCERLRDLAAQVCGLYDQRIRDLELEFLRSLRGDLERRKRERNVQCFGDLLTHVHAALDSATGDLLKGNVRSRHSAALIDEFQDTDPLQFAIFQSLFGGGERILFLIGDPKQAIYSFRGADIFAYLSATGGGVNRYTLSKNWRSEAGLVAGVNAFFKRRDAFIFPEIAFAAATTPGEKELPASKRKALRVVDNEGGHVRVWLLKPDEGQKHVTKGRFRELVSQAVAIEARRLLDSSAQGKVFVGDRSLAPQDMAVLVRAGFEGEMVQAALRDAGIPSVIAAQDDVFASDEAGELLRVLEAVAAPSSERAVRAALATPAFGLNACELAHLSSDETAWEGWIMKFAEYRDLWAGRGVMSCLGTLMGREGVRARLLSTMGGERKLTNLLHLLELAHRREREAGLSMSGLLAWLKRRADASEMAAEERQIRLESDADAVQIMTIHKSKGLEFPVVFCPFLLLDVRDESDLLLHDSENGNKLRLALNDTDDTRKGYAEREALAENLRLAYVALTRARSRCYTAWGKVRKCGKSALAYLLHFGEDTACAPKKLTETCASAFDALSHDNVVTRLKELSEACGHISILPPPGLPARETMVRAAEAGHPVPECRSLTRAITRGPALSSFTYMTKGAEPVHARSAGSREEQNDAQEESDRPPFMDFPKGARTGRAVHELFETLDFKAAGLKLLEDATHRVLDNHGFDRQWAPAVARMARSVLDGELAPGLRLRDVSLDDRLSELEFTCPLARVEPKVLATFYAKCTGAAFPEDFPARVASLSFARQHGFLTGAMDLVFRYAGRFYLLDWKSNHLGPSLVDYRPEALPRAMADHFYFLQYHIYLVALDRHLRQRLPGYAYERDFGGVFYLFLRGMDPTRPGNGIFADRPDEAFLNGLASVLAG